MAASGTPSTPAGPKEPWRTLGLPVVLAALAVLGVASLLGVVLAEAVGTVRDRLWPPRLRPSRVGAKVHNWRSLRGGAKEVSSRESR